MRKSQRVNFFNNRGLKLAGILESPMEKPPVCYAVFTHCFTCGKDLKAIVRISRHLAELGIAVLRFDFSGLGESEGEFGDSNFTTNCDDFLSAVEFLAKNYTAPALAIGHSLGGAAILASARHCASLKAVSTLAAPIDTTHLAELLNQSNPNILAEGSGEFSIGGQTFMIQSQLLDDLRSHDFSTIIETFDLPILIFHSPVDQTLEYSNGMRLFNTIQSPKSFITLDGSDHLFILRKDDVQFIATMIANWFSRFLNLQT